MADEAKVETKVEQKTEVKTVITEEELQKSLDTLAGKKEEPKKEVEQTVETAKLEKTAKEFVAEKGSEPLKKTIEVSQMLSEFVSLMGMHVDESLDSMAKSVNAAAQRDKVFLEVMVAMKKSIDDLSAKVEKYGETTPAGAKSQTTKGETVTVLEKTAGAGATKEDKKVDVGSAEGKQKVLIAMTNLAKSAQDKKEDVESNHWVRAISKFESTGLISDRDLMTVKKELGL